jgi:hypothetical protein
VIRAINRYQLPLGVFTPDLPVGPELRRWDYLAHLARAAFHHYRCNTFIARRAEGVEAYLCAAIIPTSIPSLSRYGCHWMIREYGKAHRPRVLFTFLLQTRSMIGDAVSVVLDSAFFWNVLVSLCCCLSVVSQSCLPETFSSHFVLCPFICVVGLSKNLPV